MEKDVFATYQVDGEVWGAVFPVAPALAKLKEELAELDSAIFNFTKTKDLSSQGNRRTLKLMRDRRTSLETKITDY